MSENPVKVRVDAGSPYDVVIGRGLLDETVAWAAAVLTAVNVGAAALIFCTGASSPFQDFWTPERIVAASPELLDDNCCSIVP